MSDNGRPVSNRELNDKLDVLRAEQRTEHVKTRAFAVIAAVMGSIGAKVAPLLGFFPFHW